MYSLEVYDPEKPKEALAKFALNPYPIHHPDGRDLAIIHLKQEDEGKNELFAACNSVNVCHGQRLRFFPFSTQTDAELGS